MDAPYLLSVKLRKHNINMEYNAKLALIRDYWDEQTTK